MNARTLVGVVWICVALSGLALAQGNGKGRGGGGGGGGDDGGGHPPMPAIAFNNGGHLAVMDADGGNATVILPYAGNATSLEPSWSPDGMHIVFNGTLAGSGIYVVNVDGSGLTLLKPASINGYIGAPTWSPVPAPDGNYKVLFCEEIPYAGGGTTVEIMAINLDGSDYQQLTDEPTDFPFDVTWSPSADRFATASLILQELPFVGDCKVYGLSAVDGVLGASAGTTVAQVPGSPLANTVSIGWVDWANASDTLAIAANVDGFDIWVLELSNPASPLRLGGNASERQPTWSPDDAQVVYWRTGPGPDGIFVDDSSGNGSPVLLHRNGKSPDWRP